MSIKAETQKIDFTSALNLNKCQTDIKQFTGFNIKNSPVFGGCLSPFYKKSITKPTAAAYQITRNGDVYKAFSGKLYKNDTAVMSYDETFLKKEEFTDMPDNCFNMSCDMNNKMFYLYLSDYEIMIQCGTTVIDTSIFAIEITASAIHVYLDETTGLYHFLCAISYKTTGVTTGCLTYIDCINNGTINASATINTVAYSYPYITINRDKNGVPVICMIPYYGAHNKKHFLSGYVNYVYIYNGTSLVRKDPITYAPDGTTSTGYTELNTMLETGVWINSFFYTDEVLALGNSKVIYTRSSSFYYDSTTDTIIVIAENYPAVYDTRDSTAILYKTYDLYPYYTRSVQVSPSADEGVYPNYIYDSAMPDRFAVGSGYMLDGTYVYNNIGARVQLTRSDHSTLSQFRMLINNGYPSGISIGDDGYYGVLVTDWNIIDDLFRPVVGSNFIIYKNTSDNKYYKVSSSIYNDKKLSYLFDRYILINTSGRMNCYDTVTKKELNYGTDFNANILLGYDVNTSTLDLTLPVVAGYANVTTNIYAQGKNANYELSDNQNTCLQINPMILINSIAITMAFYYLDKIDKNDTQYIDLYITSSTTATTAAYYGSCYKKLINDTTVSRINFIDSNLISAVFPITSSGNMIYNANILTEFIKSYISQDMAITDGTAYPVIYSDNTKAVPAYYLLSGVYGLVGMFVIQGQLYGLSSTQIFILSFASGVLSSATAIVDISSYTYISSNPRMAIFWSALNRSVYVFTGDRLLTKLYEANKITTINGSYYNPANYAIYIATNDGLYVITDDNMYRIDETDITGMFFTEDSFIVNNSTKLNYYKYVADTDYESIGVKIATAYFGAGNNTVSVIDTWYLRLYNNGTAQSGTVKFTINTLTDVGKVSETKTYNIKATDWDNDTGTFYIRYQPRNQRCIGAQLTVETDFPVSDMACSYSSDGVLQIAHNNI
jgi:hypothetical protein